MFVVWLAVFPILSVSRSFHLRSDARGFIISRDGITLMMIIKMQHDGHVCLRLNGCLKLFALHAADDVEIKPLLARTHARMHAIREEYRVCNFFLLFFHH